MRNVFEIATGRRLSVVLGTVMLLAAVQAARAEEPVSAQARQQFTAFCQAVGNSAGEAVDLKQARSWVRAINDTWVFTTRARSSPRSFTRIWSAVT